ncbi:GntR family transcriptional regulator [Micromonospora echinofusca]|uniref:GntR family transcriptional regulator n=1 Tax=Micromonospora echinofusca TaxID=47858 RepID=UPI00343D48DB
MSGRQKSDRYHPPFGGRLGLLGRSTCRNKSSTLRTGASGDKLPSTRELAATYQVHMNTAPRALSLLHDRELITGHPGRGTYVAERPTT